MRSGIPFVRSKTTEPYFLAISIDASCGFPDELTASCIFLKLSHNPNNTVVPAAIPPVTSNALRLRDVEKCGNCVVSMSRFASRLSLFFLLMYIFYTLLQFLSIFCRKIIHSSFFTFHFPLLDGRSPP